MARQEQMGEGRVNAVFRNHSGSCSYGRTTLNRAVDHQEPTMTRLKFFSTAALGLVLAAGTLTEVSAKPATSTHQIRNTHILKAHATKLAINSHRLRVAHLHRARKLHVVHHWTGHRVVKATGVKTTNETRATAHREHHATNDHVANKLTSVIR